MSSNSKFFWKGKRVNELVYKKRLQQVELARSMRNNCGKFKSPNLKSTSTNNKEVKNNESLNASSSVEGRRITHVKTVGYQMYCRKCKSILSLTDITGKNSDKQHKVTNQSLHFDSNTKVALGE